MAVAFRPSSEDSSFFVPHPVAFVDELEAASSGSESLGPLGEFLGNVGDSRSMVSVVGLSLSVVVMEEASPESLLKDFRNVDGIGMGSGGT